MTEAPPFWMARLKVDRAKTLINELSRELEAYRMNPEITHRVIVEDGELTIESTIERGPVKTGPILGDIIHNLRSALDLTASELARINHKDDRHVYFPISDSGETLKDRIKDKCFHLAGEDAVKLLKTFAPYRGGNAALRAIHDLDVRDKHTALIPTVHTAGFRYNIPYSEGFIQADQITVAIDPGSIELKFPDDTAFAGDEVIPTLEQLVEMVNGIVEAFARLIDLRRAEAR